MKTHVTLKGGLFLSLAVASLLITGCGKEAAPPPTAAVPMPEEQPAPAPAPEPPPAPVMAAPAEPENVEANMAAVDQHVQTQNYEAAVDVIIRAQLAAQQQQSQLSPQQRLNYHNRMRLLQKQIADAMASGDPNAQRAAQLLMQYNAASTLGGR